MHWKCTAFLSGSKVDDGELFVRGEDVDYIDRSNTLVTRYNMKVSLLDIARPAKQKGIYKLYLLVVHD